MSTKKVGGGGGGDGDSPSRKSSTSGSKERQGGSGEGKSSGRREQRSVIKYLGPTGGNQSIKNNKSNSSFGM
jgi:hypothetical protein